MSPPEQPSLLRRLAARVPAALVAIAALPFVLDLDAQWLKVDDFSMVEMFRSRPLRELVPDILLTRTTPHVRFAFLEHLLFIPFFRSGALDRSIVNAVFLTSVAALIGAGAALASTARRGSTLAWAAAFVAYLPAIWSARSWVTLEFKTALYLPFSFAMGAALVAVSWRHATAGARWSARAAAAWIALAVATFHMAEVTLAAVAVAGLALVVRRSLSPLALAFVVAWPFLYWGGNKLLVDRPANLLGKGRPGALTAGVLDTWWHAWHTFAPFTVALGVALAAALSVAVARGFRRSLPELLWILALPSSGVLLLVLTLMNSYGFDVPRYLSERHAFYVELSFAAGVALAVAWVASSVPEGTARKAGVAVALAALAVGGTSAAQRVRRMASAAELRRSELARTFAVADEIRRRRSPDRALLVFVTEWPDGWTKSWSGYIYTDPSFLHETWSREDFARIQPCAAERCGPVEFVVNTINSPKAVTSAQRRELCARAAAADVLLVTREGTLDDRPPADPVACAEWLVSRGLVGEAPEPAANREGSAP